jgi:aryl-alcohol dehydrogenase-like predicted oxidoreductase
MLALCERLGLASVNRRPLGLGLLTGKFHTGSILPASDPRVHRMGWSFAEGETAVILGRVDAIREILTSRGRTLAQGALAWIWARSGSAIPIPGFTSVEQVEENVGAMELGPLGAVEMQQIESVLSS